MHTPGGARFQVPGSDSRPVQPTLPSLRGVWIGTRPFWKGRNTDLPVDWPQQVIHCVSQILIQNCTHDIGVKCVPHPKKTNWIMRHLSLSLYVHIKQGLKADAPKHSVVALWIWRIQPGGGGRAVLTLSCPLALLRPERATLVWTSLWTAKTAPQFANSRQSSKTEQHLSRETSSIHECAWISERRCKSGHQATDYFVKQLDNMKTDHEQIT